MKDQWSEHQIDVIHETMNLDITMILKCYANGYFSPLWNEIMNIYLDGGFPCGWEGEYPQGQLVVFSNQ